MTTRLNNPFSFSLMTHVDAQAKTFELPKPKLFNLKRICEKHAAQLDSMTIDQKQQAVENWHELYSDLEAAADSTNPTIMDAVANLRMLVKLAGGQQQ